MRAAMIAMLAVAAGGCATVAPTLDATNSAELAFAKAGSADGLAGSFDSIDGERTEGAPLVVRVPAGTHVVGFSCPDVISVDFAATVEAPFVAGRRYVLDCGTDRPGTVREAAD